MCENNGNVKRCLSSWYSCLPALCNAIKPDHSWWNETTALKNSPWVVRSYNIVKAEPAPHHSVPRTCLYWMCLRLTNCVFLWQDCSQTFLMGGTMIPLDLMPNGRHLSFEVRWVQSILPEWRHWTLSNAGGVQAGNIMIRNNVIHVSIA